MFWVGPEDEDEGTSFQKKSLLPESSASGGSTLQERPTPMELLILKINCHIDLTHGVRLLSPQSGLFHSYGGHYDFPI
jgi:hypothetical protein